MGLSYAGDRLQEMAQAWLVAGLSQSSALAVGGIGFLASLPQLLMPLGGAVADRLNRYKLMIVCQIVGAAAAAGIGLLVFHDWIKIWHIYGWALLAGTIWLVSRPAFKVVLTESVPKEEVRGAVGLNSITETLAIVLVTGGGSLLLQRLGLPLAFLLNALSYGFAGFCLYMLYRSIRLPTIQTRSFRFRAILTDLLDGVTYLIKQPTLFHPLLMTLFIVGMTGPASSLLAAVIHKQGGTIVSLGMLGMAGSLGSFCGAIYAGSKADRHNPTRQYALWGCVGAGGINSFRFFASGFDERFAFSRDRIYPLFTSSLEHEPGTVSGRPGVPGAVTGIDYHGFYFGWCVRTDMGRSLCGPLWYAGLCRRGSRIAFYFNFLFDDHL